MQGVTFEGSDEYTFLGSGCNIYEHIFSRSGRAAAAGRAVTSRPHASRLLFKHYFIEISGREVAHARRGPFG